MSATTTVGAELPRGPGLPGARPASLGEALRGHSNSLGFLRLVLAALVIFHHSFPLGGFGEDPMIAWSHGQATLGSLAVAGFFAISGYLIAKSGMNADVVQFMWRRALRIFPAFWGVLIFAAFVIGPTIWLLDGNALAEYFARGGASPYGYLMSNWTLDIGTYGIRDIFTETTPYGQHVEASVINGSLWTLAYEWMCYLFIGAAVAAGVLLRARLVVPLFALLLFGLQIVQQVDPDALATAFPFFGDAKLVSLMLTFMLGAVLAVYAKKIPYSDGLGILAGVLVVVTLLNGGFELVGIPAAVYLALYLGARIGGPLRVVGAKNDYSYGIYIYGFPVQQVLAYFGVYRWGYLAFTLIALAVTAGLAWLSWHVIEKRAMALKDRGPGRGWRHWYAVALATAARRGAKASVGESTAQEPRPHGDARVEHPAHRGQ